MKKILTALMCFVAATVHSAPVDESDWIFSHPSYGVKYDSGFVRFAGSDNSAFLYYNEARIERLFGGFSAKMEMPVGVLDGASFDAKLSNVKNGGVSEWIGLSVSFSEDNLAVSISASDGSDLTRDLPIYETPSGRFELSFSFAKGDDGLFKVSVATLGETLELGGIPFSKISDGEFYMDVKCGETFEMDKDNPILSDFSYASAIPEPSTAAAILGFCALAAVLAKRRR